MNAKDQLVKDLSSGFLLDDLHEDYDINEVVSQLQIDAALHDFLYTDGKSNPGKCAKHYAEISRVTGESKLGKALVSRWFSFDEQTKANFCYAAAEASAMSNLTAIALFGHPSSGTHERHLILAGIASSAAARRAEHLVFGLIDQIGNYSDSRKQAVLERFKSNARIQFGPPRLRRKLTHTTFPLTSSGTLKTDSDAKLKADEKAKLKLAKQRYEDQLWADYFKSRSQEARNALWVNYQSLVFYIAERLKGKLPECIDAKDLLGAGNIGLQDAIDKFEPGLGIRFQSYCVPRIRGAILDSIRALDWVPRLIRHKGHQYKHTIVELTAELHREPRDDEIALRMNMTMEEFEDLRKELTVRTQISLESGSKDTLDERDLMQLEMLESRREYMSTRDMQRDEIRAIATKGLDHDEKCILQWYYFENVSMKDIAKRLQLSESRVCQIHSHVLDVLRKKFKAYENAIDLD